MRCLYDCPTPQTGSIAGESGFTTPYHLALLVCNIVPKDFDIAHNTVDLAGDASRLPGCTAISTVQRSISQAHK